MSQFGVFIFGLAGIILIYFFAPSNDGTTGWDECSGKIKNIEYETSLGPYVHSVQKTIHEYTFSYDYYYKGDTLIGMYYIQGSKSGVHERWEKYNWAEEKELIVFVNPNNIRDTSLEDSSGVSPRIGYAIFGLVVFLSSINMYVDSRKKKRKREKKKSKAGKKKNKT